MRLEIKKNNKKIHYLYHYTLNENVASILESKCIKSKDPYLFFTDSLEKSIELFEQEMMSDHLYFDLDGKLKRRVPAKKEDYKIIKIPYYNDGNFVKFEFDFQDTNSIYSKSTIYKGTLYFEKAEVLEIKEEIEWNYSFPFLKKKVFQTALFILSCSMFLPRTVHADSWTDDGNYDISWYSEPQYSFSFTTPQQLAGLNYLMKTGQQPLKNVGYKIPINYSNTDIDLTDHDWQSYMGSSKACLCGVHRVILRGGQSIGIQQCKRSTITTVNKFIIDVKTNGKGEVSVDKTEGLKGDSIFVEAHTEEPGYYISSIKLGNNNIYFNYNPETTNYSKTTAIPSYSSYYIPLIVNFSRQMFNFYYTYNDSKIQLVNAVWQATYGDDYTIQLNPEPGFIVSSVTINDNPYTVHDNTIIIQNVKEDKNIIIDVKRITPTMNFNDQEIVVDMTKFKKISDSTLQLEEYVFQYLLDMNVLKGSWNNKDHYEVKTALGKTLFEIDQDRNIILSSSVNENDNIYFEIDDEFREYFEFISDNELLDNYKKVSIKFSNKSTCQNSLTIKNIKVIDSTPNLSDSNEAYHKNGSINFRTDFKDVNDYIVYEFEVDNQDNSDYKFDESAFKDKNYEIIIKYDNDENVIKKNGKTKVQVTISYKKDYFNDASVLYSNTTLSDTVKMIGENGELTDIVNPKTSSNYLKIIIFVILLIVVILLIRKKSVKYKMVVILIGCCIMIPVFAETSCQKGIEMSFDISINKEEVFRKKLEAIKEEMMKICATSEHSDIVPLFTEKDSFYFESYDENDANAYFNIYIGDETVLGLEIPLSMEYDAETGDLRINMEECNKYSDYRIVLYSEYGMNNACSDSVNMLKSMDDDCIYNLAKNDTYIGD